MRALARGVVADRRQPHLVLAAVVGRDGIGHQAHGARERRLVLVEAHRVQAGRARVAGRGDDAGHHAVGVDRHAAAPDRVLGQQRRAARIGDLEEVLAGGQPGRLRWRVGAGAAIEVHVRPRRVDVGVDACAVDQRGEDRAGQPHVGGLLGLPERRHARARADEGGEQEHSKVWVKHAFGCEQHLFRRRSTHARRRLSREPRVSSRVPRARGGPTSRTGRPRRPAAHGPDVLASGAAASDPGRACRARARPGPGRTRARPPAARRHCVRCGSAIGPGALARRSSPSMEPCAAGGSRCGTWGMRW